MTTPKLEAIARAIESVDVGHSLTLTRLVEGVSTYTLKMAGHEDEQFEWIEDGYELIAERKRLAIARAVLTELLELDEAMVRAALAVRWPAMYREHLRHPASGPKRKHEEEAEIEQASAQIRAAIQSILEGE